jgi:hypothetical protein
MILAFCEVLSRLKGKPIHVDHPRHVLPLEDNLLQLPSRAVADGDALGCKVYATG